MARKQIKQQHQQPRQPALHFGDEVYLYVSLRPGDDSTCLPCRGIAIDKLNYNKFKIALTEVYTANLSGKIIPGADKLLGKKINRTINHLSKELPLLMKKFIQEDKHWIKLNDTQKNTIVSTRH